MSDNVQMAAGVQQNDPSDRQPLNANIDDPTCFIQERYEAVYDLLERFEPNKEEHTPAAAAGSRGNALQSIATASSASGNNEESCAAQELSIDFSRYPIFLAYRNPLVETAFVHHHLDFLKVALCVNLLVISLPVAYQMITFRENVVSLAVGVIILLDLVGFSIADILLLFIWKCESKEKKRMRAFLHEYITLFSMAIGISCLAVGYYTQTSEGICQSSDSLDAEEKYAVCVRSIYSYIPVAHSFMFFIGRPRSMMIWPVTLISIVAKFASRPIYPNDNNKEMGMKIFADAIILSSIFLGIRAFESFFRGSFEVSVNLELQRRKARKTAEQTMMYLEQVMPPFVCERLVNSSLNICDDASVLVCEICNYSEWSFTMLERKAVRTVMTLQAEIESLIKTSSGVRCFLAFGDRVLAVSNLVDPNRNHAADCLRVASKLIESSSEPSSQRSVCAPMHCCVHSGTVVGGFVGTTFLKYHVWGEVVDAAFSIVSAAPTNSIILSQATLTSFQRQYGRPPSRSMISFVSHYSVLVESLGTEFSTFLASVQKNTDGENPEHLTPRELPYSTLTLDERDASFSGTTQGRTNIEEPRQRGTSQENCVILAEDGGAETAQRATGADMNSIASSSKQVADDVKHNPYELRTLALFGQQQLFRGSADANADSKGERLIRLMASGDVTSMARKYEIVRSCCLTKFLDPECESNFKPEVPFEMRICALGLLGILSMMCMILLFIEWEEWTVYRSVGLCMLATPLVCLSPMAALKNLPVPVDVAGAAFCISLIYFGAALTRPSFIANMTLYQVPVTAISMISLSMPLKGLTSLICLVCFVYVPWVGSTFVFEAGWVTTEIYTFPACVLLSLIFLVALDYLLRQRHRSLMLFSGIVEAHKFRESFYEDALRSTVPECFLQDALRFRSDNVTKVTFIECTTVVQLRLNSSRLKRETAENHPAAASRAPFDSSGSAAVSSEGEKMMNHAGDSPSGHVLNLTIEQGFEMPDAALRACRTLQFIVMVGDDLLLAGPLNDKTETAAFLSTIEAMDFLQGLRGGFTAVVTHDSTNGCLGGGSVPVGYNLLGRAVTEARALMAATPQGTTIVTAHFHTAYHTALKVLSIQRNEAVNPFRSDTRDEPHFSNTARVWRVRGMGGVEVFTVNFS